MNTLTRMAASIAVTMAAGCFDPSLPPGLRCGPGRWCPTGQTCGDNTQTCSTDAQRSFRKTVDVPSRRNIDILFIINDSPSMVEEQASLALNFPLFTDTLQGIQGGLPNVHIGVVSTNLGANAEIASCAGSGDDGSFRFDLVGDAPACSDGTVALSGPFIEDVLINEENGERTRNYQGDLADVFGCVAALGTSGCAFTQPLEAMRKALDKGQRNGFLRDDAYLAVIFVSDEDDCSAFEPYVFDTEDVGQYSQLGPLTTFRCFEFGVQCTPDQARVLGEKTACVPRADSPYLYDIDEYVRFLESLKATKDKIIVAGIVGTAAAGPDGRSVVVEEALDQDMNPVPALQPACESATGKAIPAVRLQSFLEQFPERNTLVSMCDENLSPALIVISSELSAILDNPFCLDASVFLGVDDSGPKHDCVVVEALYGVEKELPYCQSPESPGDETCWYIRENQVGCSETGQPFQELVIAGSEPQNEDAELAIACRVPEVDASVP